mmetsp:Transcript_34434/g.81177  ORF Transcript_34434/g.81177 Transcript_34434/m.81177 type:complete len:244 (+) Transcript_34434:589-1320(+)
MRRSCVASCRSADTRCIVTIAASMLFRESSGIRPRRAEADAFCSCSALFSFSFSFSFSFPATSSLDSVASSARFFSSSAPAGAGGFDSGPKTTSSLKPPPSRSLASPRARCTTWSGSPYFSAAYTARLSTHRPSTTLQVGDQDWSGRMAISIRRLRTPAKSSGSSKISCRWVVNTPLQRSWLSCSRTAPAIADPARVSVPFPSSSTSTIVCRVASRRMVAVSRISTANDDSPSAGESYEAALR